MLKWIIPAAAAVLLPAGAVAAEDWRLVMQTRTYAVGVDIHSIRREGAIARASMMTASTGREGGPHRTRGLAVMDMEIDCAARRGRRLAGIVTHPDGSHGTRMGEGSWDALGPDTPVGALVAALCDATPPDPRSSADPVAFGRFALELPEAGA